MKKNDGKTWERKHIWVHKIQDLLGLSDTDTANLLGVREKTLSQIYVKAYNRIFYDNSETLCPERDTCINALKKCRICFRTHATKAYTDYYERS